MHISGDIMHFELEHGLIPVRVQSLNKIIIGHVKMNEYLTHMLWDWSSIQVLALWRIVQLYFLATV